MSLVTLQLGQCGNQVGTSLFNVVADEINRQNGVLAEDFQEVFFRPVSDRHSGQGAQQHARAVLVDMEQKAVAAALRPARGASWGYAPCSSLTQQSGSGNNWARGYCEYGPKHTPDVIDLVRREVEAADYLGGILTLQSAAGGTGSGFGAAVMEGLRDELPSTLFLNHTVWPFDSGEVIVQSYNTLLTLQHLTASCDAIILAENSALHRTCQRMLNIARPSLPDLNGVIAHDLASVLLPAKVRGGRRLSLLSGLLVALGGHPAYKLASLQSVPQLPASSVDFTSFAWPGLLKRLRQMLITGAFMEEGLDWSATPSPHQQHTWQRPHNKALSALLTLRGSGASTADTHSFTDPALFPSWQAEPLTVTSTSVPFARCEMSASLLSCNQACAQPAARMQTRATSMLAARAYVHQYEAFGLGLSDLQEAVCSATEVVGRYAMLG
ncbi:hypothetical protein WJX74_007509 [Apatococcus lobatus]|uniref:Tubulin delta chain n=1 Tax=Apatococcus lobatus TaxID=904363 RepID=A0AAW1Q6Z7_9CHLO